MVTVSNEATTQWASFQQSIMGSFRLNSFASRNVITVKRTGGYMPFVVWSAMPYRLDVSWTFPEGMTPFQPYEDPNITSRYIEGPYSGTGGTAAYEDDWRNYEHVQSLHAYYTDTGAYGRTSPPRNSPHYKNVFCHLYGTIKLPVVVPHLVHGFVFGIATYRNSGVPIAPPGYGVPRGVTLAGLPLHAVDSYTPLGPDDPNPGRWVGTSGQIPWPGYWPFGAVSVRGVTSYEMFAKLWSFAGALDGFQYYYRQPYTYNFRPCWERRNYYDPLAGDILFRVESLPGEDLHNSVWFNSQVRLERSMPDYDGSHLSGDVRWLRDMADNIESRFP